MKISRRKFLWGSTAIATVPVAAMLPAAKPLPPMVTFTAGEISPLLDLRPEKVLFISNPEAKIINLKFFEVSGDFQYREMNPRTAADDLVDFGQSFEIDGRRIPPEEWPEVDYDGPELDPAEEYASRIDLRSGRFT